MIETIARFILTIILIAITFIFDAPINFKVIVWAMMGLNIVIAAWELYEWKYLEKEKV